MAGNVDRAAVDVTHNITFDQVGIHTAPAGKVVDGAPTALSYIVKVAVEVPIGSGTAFDGSTPTAIVGVLGAEPPVIWGSARVDSEGTTEIPVRWRVREGDTINVLLASGPAVDSGDPGCTQGQATLHVYEVLGSDPHDDPDRTALHGPLGNDSYAADDPASPVASPHQAPNTKVGAPGFVEGA